MALAPRLPEGGVLRIVTANTQATRDDGSSAEFVRIDFVDTGTGMAPEVLARAWEPFFTTKPAGKGTGLGLATVYGFVKQSGGNATLESAPGAGTTVSLTLPKGAPSALRARCTSRDISSMPNAMRSSTACAPMNSAPRSRNS